MVGGGVRKLLFDAESKNHKIPNSHYGGGEGGFRKLLFDAESKNHKIPYSYYGGGGGVSENYFLMLSPKIIKCQIPITVGGGSP